MCTREDHVSVSAGTAGQAHRITEFAGDCRSVEKDVAATLQLEGARKSVTETEQNVAAARRVHRGFEELERMLVITGGGDVVESERCLVAGSDRVIRGDGFEPCTSFHIVMRELFEESGVLEIADAFQGLGHRAMEQRTLRGPEIVVHGTAHDLVYEAHASCCPHHLQKASSRRFVDPGREVDLAVTVVVRQ